MKVAAKIISSVLHPLLMPVIGLLILFNTNSYINHTVPLELKKVVMLMVMLCTFIVPLLITLILVQRKIISSLEKKPHIIILIKNYLKLFCQNQY